MIFGLYFAVGAAVGICFATVCIVLANLSDEKYRRQNFENEMTDRIANAWSDGYKRGQEAEKKNFEDFWNSMERIF